MVQIACGHEGPANCQNVCLHSYNLLRSLPMLGICTCSAINRSPLFMDSSNVSPRMGLKGFHVRSLPGNGPIVNPTTHASLNNRHTPQSLSRTCIYTNSAVCSTWLRKRIAGNDSSASCKGCSNGSHGTQQWQLTSRRDLQSWQPFQVCLCIP